MTTLFTLLGTAEVFLVGFLVGLIVNNKPSMDFIKKMFTFKKTKNNQQENA